MNLSGSYTTDIARDVYGDLRKHFISSDPSINTVLGQIFTQQGKVVRPLFMSLVGELVGVSWERLRHAAVIVEAIHIASLIHDDVVDDSDLRRGKATLNARFSDKLSVLFGDDIFLKALHMAHSFEHPRVYDILYQAVKRMIQGEICEELYGGEMDEVMYLKIIGNKTASLFAASAEIAIILSDGDDDTAVMGRDLGEAVGMAFQIVDDTLDFVGETEIMGKPRHADIASERFTLPAIHALRDCRKDEIVSLIAERETSHERLAEMVGRNGGIKYAYGRARDYSEKARSILGGFGNGKAIAIFDDFFDMLVTRAS